MKKTKAVLVAVVAVLIFYIGFVTVDCIRLRNADPGTKPIVTTGMIKTDMRVNYSALGYNIEYYSNSRVHEKPYYGAEFRLFNKIVIWAWVE